MSGGYFDYKQYVIDDLIENIQKLIDTAGENDWNNYSKETLREFEYAIRVLKVASIYTNRIDYLASADDGEEQFHKHLTKQLLDLTKESTNEI